MSIHDEEAPPVVMPPVTRDPTLGLRRDQSPLRVDDEGKQLSPRALRAYQRGNRIGGIFGAAAARAVQFALLVLALSALGLLAHGAWDAIMLGWRLVG